MEDAMKTTDLVTALQKLSFTHGLPRQHRQLLADISVEAQFNAGHVFFREGEPGTVLYLIQRGRVAIEIPVPGRGRISILTVGPGEIFGWSSIFAASGKTAGARAVEDTATIAIDARKLMRACQKDPKLGFELMLRVVRVVAARLQVTRLQLLDVFAPDVITQE
jgi:CRP-like cAMP-binding protein